MQTIHTALSAHGAVKLAAINAREARTFERTVVSLRTRKGARLHMEMWDTKAQIWRGTLRMGWTDLEIAATAEGVEIIAARTDYYWPFSQTPDGQREATAEERARAEAALAWIWAQVREDAIAEGRALRARDLAGAAAKAAELEAEGYADAAAAIRQVWGLAA